MRRGLLLQRVPAGVHPCWQRGPRSLQRGGFRALWGRLGGAARRRGLQTFVGTALHADDHDRCIRVAGAGSLLSMYAHPGPWTTSWVMTVRW